MGGSVACQDLREFLHRLDELGELQRVEVAVDPELEIAAITDRASKLPAGGPALLFSRVQGSPFPVATNLFGSARRMATALGRSTLTDLTGWLAGLLAPLPGASATTKLAALAASNEYLTVAPQVVTDSPCQEVVEAFPDLTGYPILKCWPADGTPDHGGRFLTLPLVITRDPESGRQNCGMYRVAVLGSDRAAIHWSATSGGARHGAAWQARGERQPVAIALGGDPAITFCATLPLPDTLDEFTFAGLLRGEPVALARCRTNDLLVPAGAELVIEGFLEPGETVPDGAFGNHTGAYVPGMVAPLLQITAITRRHDMHYPATVVGPPPMEDCWLARAAERLLLALMRIDLPEIVEISQPLAGIFHGATVVAVNKSAAGQGKELLAALRQSPWLGKARLLVLVDAEQDPADYDGVYWRVLNQADWQRDLVSDGERLGIDATRKLAAELAGEPEREPLRQSEEIVRLVARRWAEYGFEKR
jgi:4-hydroxy-3-polyprenylbenzoate decarboxylase